MFEKGALVTALKEGRWVELKLAPTEVLEALNRCGSGFGTVLYCVRMIQHDCVDATRPGGLCLGRGHW